MLGINVRGQSFLQQTTVRSLNLLQMRADLSWRWFSMIDRAGSKK